MTQKSSSSDYYTDWLGIPAGPRPPNHYALLGLRLFEANLKKVSEAAAARLRMVRQYGLKYPEESTALLNAIAAAEVCLLDPDSKRKYDQAFQIRLAEPVEDVKSVASASPDKQENFAAEVLFRAPAENEEVIRIQALGPEIP